MIVLDTNVVSELMRPTPAPAVLTWLRQTSTTGLYTTSVTVAEIRYGIARLPDGRRKHDLDQAATLATRNTKDFIDTGVTLIDPWQ
jgi:toxin FitB